MGADLLHRVQEGVAGATEAVCGRWPWHVAQGGGWQRAQTLARMGSMAFSVLQCGLKVCGAQPVGQCWSQLFSCREKLPCTHTGLAGRERLAAAALRQRGQPLGRHNIQHEVNLASVPSLLASLVFSVSRTHLPEGVGCSEGPVIEPICPVAVWPGGAGCTQPSQPRGTPARSLKSTAHPPPATPIPTGLEMPAGPDSHWAKCS